MNSFSFIGAGLLAMGGLAAWISFYFWSKSQDLRSAGVEARATLLRKFRKQTAGLLGAIENYYVAAQFVDAYGRALVVDIRVPSQQWRWLRPGAAEMVLYLPTNPGRARVITKVGQAVVSAILLCVSLMTAAMALGGCYFLYVGWMQPAEFMAARIPDPPRSQFTKEGVSPVFMMASPAHDRVAVISQDGNSLSVRELGAGSLMASRRGNRWRLLGWRPDGARIAVDAAGAALVLDGNTLATVAGESYTWAPAAPAATGCAEPTAPIWNPAGSQAAVPCGNDVVIQPAGIRLSGHTDRVVGAAWSPSGRRVASVSEDNYVRVWDAGSGRCVAVSEDYPYPRAIYFSGENAIGVIDVALRRYSMAVP